MLTSTTNPNPNDGGTSVPLVSAYYRKEIIMQNQYKFRLEVTDNKNNRYVIAEVRHVRTEYEALVRFSPQYRLKITNVYNYPNSVLYELSHGEMFVRIIIQPDPDQDIVVIENRVLDESVVQKNPFTVQQQAPQQTQAQGMTTANAPIQDDGASLWNYGQSNLFSTLSQYEEEMIKNGYETVQTPFGIMYSKNPYEARQNQNPNQNPNEDYVTRMLRGEEQNHDSAQSQFWQSTDIDSLFAGIQRTDIENDYTTPDIKGELVKDHNPIAGINGWNPENGMSFNTVIGQMGDEPGPDFGSRRMNTPAENPQPQQEPKEDKKNN